MKQLPTSEVGFSETHDSTSSFDLYNLIFFLLEVVINQSKGHHAAVRKTVRVKVEW